ncbi:phosphatase PAP2 family protein [Actinomadura rupiterrae]|uniref:phosphatase PAP2 family protein n=1 Tax=Actinomadura rupiterrae TaxID=559627 RepID=UPI0027E33352|nr:phosphatase PAP2 family protein [Actinomadura rupiterrae]MCP2343100.1 undecaprenyl-diphosphatase [Actinomadura rupiterrae]
MLRPGGGRLPGRALRAWALPLLAALIAAATVLDVLAGGLLRHADDRVFAGGLPPRTGAWHWFWRTVVNGGQYWLVGTLVTLVALRTAWRRRSLATAVRAGIWLLGTEAAIRAAQTAFARTPPRTGADHLFTGGYLSFPSGHAANAAACLTVTAALLHATRRWWIAVHALIAAVAVGVVALGYHWPTDALAGWSLGLVLGAIGRVLIGPGPETARPDRGSPGPATRAPRQDSPGPQIYKRRHRVDPRDSAPGTRARKG